MATFRRWGQEQPPHAHLRKRLSSALLRHKPSAATTQVVILPEGGHQDLALTYLPPICRRSDQLSNVPILSNDKTSAGYSHCSKVFQSILLSQLRPQPDPQSHSEILRAQNSSHEPSLQASTGALPPAPQYIATEAAATAACGQLQWTVGRPPLSWPAG